MDFIIAATITWAVIAYIWTLSFSSYDKSVLTFIVGAFMLPLAFLLSKVLKNAMENPGQSATTSWTVVKFCTAILFPLFGICSSKISRLFF